MATLFLNDFSGGWQPQSDPINGPKNALLKMDNVDLDKNGSLSLSNGTQNWVPATNVNDTAHTIASAFLAAGLRLYLGLENGRVIRSDKTTNTILSSTGGSTTRAAFLPAFDEVLIFSGNYRVRSTGAAESNLGVGEPTAAPTLQSGGSGDLVGTYEYLQINVIANNSRISKSIIGPISLAITAAGEAIEVTPQDPAAIDARVNEVWIYRRGQELDTWYRIRRLTSSLGAAFDDNLIDIDALTINEQANINVESTDSTGLPEAIIDAVGPVNQRIVMLSATTIYFSEINSPDTYIPGQAVKFAGGAELFKWAKLLGENAILIGTNKDVYFLSGTFKALPDGILDVHLRPLGIKTPPISKDADLYGNSVVYMSSMGWTMLSSEVQITYLNPPLTDRLYFGESFEGYGGVPIFTDDTFRYSCAIANNKLYVRIPYIVTADPLAVNYRMEVYDFTRRYWRTIPFVPEMIISTEDNLVLGFFDADKTIKIIDFWGHKRLDTSAGTKQSFAIKTVFQDNGQPRNRKDAATAKFFINTGGDNVALTLFEDGSASGASLGNISSSSLSEVFVDISSLGLFKQIQIQLAGQVADLQLSNISIDYEPRPEQVTYLRIPNRNFGTSARKRLPNLAIRIDTLSGNVTWTPVLDGVVQSGQTVNTAYDKTVIYPFLADTIALDIGHVLSGAGLFEFYEEIPSELIEKFNTAIRFFRLPETDYGTPNKKRVRTIPFVLDPLGDTVTFTPVVDGVAGTASTFGPATGKKVYFHYFATDVFGIEYSGSLSSASPFELFKVHDPEIVQVLPVAKRFDQVGPREFFRYGRVKQLEFHLIAFDGTSIPYEIFFQDTTVATGSITVVSAKQSVQTVKLPPTIAGQIIRVELGPTAFDFHRLATRVQASITGRDTELAWISLEDDDG
jgi:hypothetical protein